MPDNPPPVPSDPQAGKNPAAEDPAARRNVCNCFQVTYGDLQKMFDATNGAGFEVLKKYYHVGSRCTSCEYEIKDLITVYREERRLGHIGIGGGTVPWRRRLERAYRELRDSVRRRLTLRRFGLFVVRDPSGESSLTLSNLKFPEDHSNANGREIVFHLTLFDAAGRVLGRRTGLRLPSGASREYFLPEVFPDLPARFHGMLFVDYARLHQVGSLRPYCCFNFDRGEGGYRGRWHYHDKYSLAPYNGHFHNNHPLIAGQDCWMAVSNPCAAPYAGTVRLRTADGRIWAHAFTLPPHGSWWGRVRDLFPGQAEVPAADPNALLWLDHNQRLMVWFFWHKLDGNIWVVQHH
ncbi:MAG: (2Fe-2S)-binding protein [Opitutaceae bacterium]|nr:(2Fe-2S)-binding protein [Opitutaceae bacterium]